MLGRYVATCMTNDSGLWEVIAETAMEGPFPFETMGENVRALLERRRAEIEQGRDTTFPGLTFEEIAMDTAGREGSFGWQYVDAVSGAIRENVCVVSFVAACQCV